MYRSTVPKLQSCWDTSARPWPKGKSMCHTEIIAWRSPLRDAVDAVATVGLRGTYWSWWCLCKIFQEHLEWQHPGAGNVVVQDGKVTVEHGTTSVKLSFVPLREMSANPKATEPFKPCSISNVHFTWWPQMILHVVPFPCCKATSITQVTKSLEAIAERFLGWQCQDLGADLKGDGGTHETDEKSVVFHHIYIIHMSYPFHFASALSTVSTPVFSKGPAVFGLFPLETFGNMTRHDAMMPCLRCLWTALPLRAIWTRRPLRGLAKL